jgi:hypothetical protein
MFCPEGDGVPPDIAICEDCVVTCAKAIDVEKRLSSRPHAVAEDEGDPDDEAEPGPIVEWSAFAMAGVALEWRADRNRYHAARPLFHVALRRDGEVWHTGQLHERMPSAEEVRFALATERLAESAAQPRSQPSDEPPNWRALPGEPGFEWRAEKVWAASAGLEVNVRVRRAGDDSTTVHESYGYATHPTVDDAESIAEDHWEKLHG